MTYEEKINLYENKGGNSFLVKMFRSGNTGFNVRKLEDELRKQADSASLKEAEHVPEQKKKTSRRS